ncbi:class I SAM-dependent methyltransferase [uncultured Jatrophihabitans sp.]|uniref:class I SAM-dependent methyltransferase n=1 Tax=uncultured Jatrophihabitans sp. TaxID=1610747 RepID=UPI0035CA5080
MSRTVVVTAVDRLRDELRDRPPLEALEPSEYATTHALFEARSDQRANLTSWVVRHVAARATSASRVLSLGCGDGSVDVQVAAALAAFGRPVDYVGVEPHAPSGRVFRDRLEDLATARPTLVTDTFAQARPAGLFDVVLAVHSLYYVDDLASTVRRAHSLLTPGGELVILHAPREPLNTLVPILCPGRRQPFSDQLLRLTRAEWRPTVTRIDARLDLTASGDPEVDRQLLEFTVQARLPDRLLPLVRDALADHTLPGPGTVLPHPVDAFVIAR